jgi:multidrug resistance efflux pump
MKMRQMLPVLLGGGLLLASLLGARQLLPELVRQSPSPAPVSTDAREPGKMGFVALGKVEKEGGIQYLFPMLGGEVVSVLVKDGDHVQAGQTLLTFDDTLSRAKVQQAEGGVEEARAKLLRAEQGLKQFQLGLQEQETAIAAEKVKLQLAEWALGHAIKLNRNSPTAYDVHDLELKVEAQKLAVKAAEQKLARLKESDPSDYIAEAKGNLKYREGLLAAAQYELSLMEFKAKVPGTVLRVEVKPGMQYSPKPQQPALWFEPDGKQIVRAEIEQERSNRVQVGTKVKVRDHLTVNGPVYTGTITSVGASFLPRRTIQMPDPFIVNEPRVLEFVVTLDDIPSHAPPLRNGQIVRVLANVAE